MKRYLTLFILLSSLQGYGQDWFPWKVGGEYYYSAGEGQQFWIIRQDSIDGDDYLLNSKLVGPGLAGCEDSLGYFGPMLHDYKFYFDEDSTIIDGEYIQFVINHRADVGAIWFHEAIGFSLESLELREVFGTADSVAVFLIHDDDFESLIDGDSIVLSKSFGVLNMPSFNNLIDGYYRDFNLGLISIKTESFDFGPRYPLFEDLLPLELGDYMLFKYTVDDFGSYYPGYEKYYGKYYLSRDVIDENNFSLTYSKVNYFDGFPEYVGTYTDTIKRITWEQMIYRDDRLLNFNHESSEIGTFENDENYIHLQYVVDVQYQGQVNDALIFSWKMDRVSEERSFIDTTNCEFLDWGEFSYRGGYTYYSTLTGMYCKFRNLYYDYDASTPAHDCLIGYSIGDLEWGELSVPTDIVSATLPKVQIFPNPVNEVLHCFAGQLQLANYSIYSNNGQLIESGQWQAGKGIHVQALPPGMYVLQLMADADAYMAYFMKQ